MFNYLRLKKEQVESKLGSDDFIERMGIYFEYFELRKIHGWSFEYFLKLAAEGRYNPEIHLKGLRD